jgi:hypothetical protein
MSPGVRGGDVGGGEGEGLQAMSDLGEGNGSTCSKVNKGRRARFTAKVKDARPPIARREVELLTQGVRVQPCRLDVGLVKDAEGSAAKGGRVPLETRDDVAHGRGAAAAAKICMCFCPSQGTSLATHFTHTISPTNTQTGKQTDTIRE